MTDRLISAVPVPFHADATLDRATLDGLLVDLAPHVDSVLMAGTTGEFPALDDEERLQVFSAAVDVLGPDRVIAHVGHGSARQVVRLAEATRGLGIDRLALLSPWYLPTDAAGTIAYFASLSDAQPDATLYAYVFPERTGADVSPEVLREVLGLTGFCGVKLSGGAAARLSDYLAVTGDHAVWSGDDSAFDSVLRAGGHGVVSGVSSVFPRTFAALRDALASQDETHQALVQSEVERLVSLVGPSVSRLKVGLAARTGAVWSSRMALHGVPEDVEQQIKQAVVDHG